MAALAGRLKLHSLFVVSTVVLRCCFNLLLSANVSSTCSPQVGFTIVMQGGGGSAGRDVP